MKNLPTRRTVVLAAGLLPTLVLAHGKTDHPKTGAPVKKEQQAWGVAGDAGAVARTVQIRMSDQMRFTPDLLQVTLGQTLRLVVHNDGKLMHEFVIGTKPALDEHAALMLRFPDMEHDEPWMAHVPPGERGELVWRFNRAGEFHYACLIAGHYQAGMIGQVRVSARPA